MMVRVETLGGLRLFRDGEELDSLLGKPVQCALLVYLAVERSATRDTLLDLLWPEKDGDRARRSLNNTVYELRGTLGSDWASWQGDTLRIASWIQTDSAGLPSDLAGEENALDLGGFLEGCYLVSTPALEHWIARVRREIRAQRLRRDKERVSTLHAAGDLQGALRAAIEWANRRPLDDEAQYWAIRLSAEAGHRGDALSRFEVYRERLHEEYEASPDKEFLDLIARVRAAEVSGELDLGYASSRNESQAQDKDETSGVRTPDDAWRPKAGWVKKLVTALSLYAVPSAGLLQVLDYLIEYIGLPPSFFPAALVLILFGMPIVAVTVLLESQPVLRRDLSGLRFFLARWFSWRNAALGALAAAAAWSAAVVGWLLVGTAPAAELDKSRVVVFPLVERGAGAAVLESGETTALRIVSALERTDPLRSLWGWTYLDVDERRDIRVLTAERADSIAEGLQAGFYLTGDVAVADQGVNVVLRLYDVAGDSLMRQQTRSGSTVDSLSQVALGAMLDLLPVIVEPGIRVDPLVYQDRDVGAAALWMQGEKAYRRAQYSNAHELLSAAVARDGALAMASLRAAQSANWLNEDALAIAFVDSALAYSSDLPSRYINFAAGLRRYLIGDADGAVAALEAALGEDEAWSDPWMVLGETFRHLLPQRVPRDSLARAALTRALELDPAFTLGRFHLAEMALVAGDLGRARDHREAFLSSSPDPASAAHLGLMFACVEEGEADWGSAIGVGDAVLQASTGMVRSIEHAECGLAGYDAYRTSGHATTLGYWDALIGSVSAFIALDRSDEARELLHEERLSGNADAEYLGVFAASADDAFAPEAKQFIDGLDQDIPENSTLDLWARGLWLTREGDADGLTLVAAELRRRAAEPGARSRTAVFATAMSAHAAFLSEDTDVALALLEELRPAASRPNITWSLWDSLPRERLLLAEILLKRGESERARAITLEFERATPVPYLAFLRQSRTLASLTEAAGSESRASAAGGG